MEEKIITPQDIIKEEGITEESVKELADNVGMELSDEELDKEAIKATIMDALVYKELINPEQEFLN